MQIRTIQPVRLTSKGMNLHNIRDYVELCAIKTSKRCRLRVLCLGTLLSKVIVIASKTHTIRVIDLACYFYLMKGVHCEKSRPECSSEEFMFCVLHISGIDDCWDLVDITCQDCYDDDERKCHANFQSTCEVSPPPA